MALAGSGGGAGLGQIAGPAGCYGATDTDLGRASTPVAGKPEGTGNPVAGQPAGTMDKMDKMDKK